MCRRQTFCGPAIYKDSLFYDPEHWLGDQSMLALETNSAINAVGVEIGKYGDTLFLYRGFAVTLLKWQRQPPGTGIETNYLRLQQMGRDTARPSAAFKPR